MKHLSLLLLFAVPTALTQSGCKQSQQQQAQTLEAVGLTAKLTMDSAAIALREGKLSVEKWEKMAYIYDTKFQPAFRVALAQVEGNTKGVAPLALVAIANELSLLLK